MMGKKSSFRNKGVLSIVSFNLTLSHVAICIWNGKTRWGEEFGGTDCDSSVFLWLSRWSPQQHLSPSRHTDHSCKWWRGWPSICPPDDSFFQDSRWCSEENMLTSSLKLKHLCIIYKDKIGVAKNFKFGLSNSKKPNWESDLQIIYIITITTYYIRIK